LINTKGDTVADTTKAITRAMVSIPCAIAGMYAEF
jgi:hypothetical protein